MAVGLVVLGLFPTAPLPVIICAFGLYAFFSGGPGILQWLYPNELFPTEVRATAVGLAIGISRVGTIVATYGTPIFMAAVRHRADHARGSRPGDFGTGAVDLHGAGNRRQIARRDKISL